MSPILPGEEGTPGPTVPKRGPTVGRPRNTTPPKERFPVVPAPDRKDGPGMVVAISSIDGLTSGKVLDQPLYFQCPPTDAMEPQFSWAWNDYATVGSGMHSNPNFAQLMTVTFNTLIVDDVEVHRIGNSWIKGPRYAVAALQADDLIGFTKYLKQIGDEQTPFALQWGQPALWGKWDWLMAATLREFRSSEREGELDARYLTLTFTEFPDAPKLRPVHAPLPPGKHKKGGRTRGGQRVLARLNSRDLPASMHTLALIAKHYYHSPSRWRLIAKASGGMPGVGANTDLPSTVGRKHPPKTIIVPALPAGTGS